MYNRPIPDAPYIREAELEGYPHRKPVLCPHCGKDCETIYMIGSDALGCEHCVDVVDADVWQEEVNDH